MTTWPKPIKRRKTSQFNKFVATLNTTQFLPFSLKPIEANTGLVVSMRKTHGIKS